jgi:inositol 3-alpha-galactosyltransferase
VNQSASCLAIFLLILMRRLPENCAYTPQRHPNALTTPTPILSSSIRTHTLLNSGLVILHPSKLVFKAMTDFLYNDPLVRTFSFPDQDFLAHFFRGRWKPIGWQYNAVKTGRYEHPEMWRDEEVRNIHYIVKKPWAVGRSIGERDEVTHGWWWDAFLEWEREAQRDIVEEVMKYVNQEYGV